MVNMTPADFAGQGAGPFSNAGMLRNPVPSVPLAAPVQQLVAPMQQPGAPGLVAPTSDTWRGTLGRLRGHERRYGG